MRHGAFLWKNPWRWLTRIVLLAAVVWFASYSVWDAHDRAVWRERGVRTTAVVTDLSCAGRGSYVHLEVDGTSRVVVPCPRPLPHVGERVAVVYHSADGSRVRLAQQFERTSGRAPLGVALGTTVLLGILEGSWWWERRRSTAEPEALRIEDAGRPEQEPRAR